MNSSIDTRSARACVRLDALLRELVAVPDFAALDRRAFVEAAALVLSELVDQGQLSDETADRLWLELAGRRPIAALGQPRPPRPASPERPDLAGRRHPPA